MSDGMLDDSWGKVFWNTDDSNIAYLTLTKQNQPLQIGYITFSSCVFKFFTVNAFGFWCKHLWKSCNANGLPWPWTLFYLALKIFKHYLEEWKRELRLQPRKKRKSQKLCLDSISCLWERSEVRQQDSCIAGGTLKINEECIITTTFLTSIFMPGTLKTCCFCWVFQGWYLQHQLIILDKSKSIEMMNI